MKKLLLAAALLFFVAVNCPAPRMLKIYIPPPTAEEIAQAKQDQKDAVERDLIEKQKYFIPRDPWRFCVEYDPDYSAKPKPPAPHYAKGVAWFQFYGKVMRVDNKGILIQGWYGPAMDFAHGNSNAYFFVRRFPYHPKPDTVLVPLGNYVAQASEQRYLNYETLDYCPVTNAPNLTAPPPLPAISVISVTGVLTKKETVDKWTYVLTIACRETGGNKDIEIQFINAEGLVVEQKLERVKMATGTRVITGEAFLSSPATTVKAIVL